MREKSVKQLWSRCVLRTPTPLMETTVNIVSCCREWSQGVGSQIESFGSSLDKWQQTTLISTKETHTYEKAIILPAKLSGPVSKLSLKLVRKKFGGDEIRGSIR